MDDFPANFVAPAMQLFLTDGENARALKTKELEIQTTARIGADRTIVIENKRRRNGCIHVSMYMYVIKVPTSVQLCLLEPGSFCGGLTHKFCVAGGLL